MVEIRQAAILAGGLGTRLRPLTDTIPKPMAPVNGQPFLEYLIRLLRENGIAEVVLMLGYLADKVMDHFGDGKRFGMRVRYSVGEVPDETGTRVRLAAPMLDDRFLLMYCDNYWPLRLRALERFHKRHQGLATMTVYANRDGVTRNNVQVDDQGRILRYDKTRKGPDLNGVDIGFFILHKQVLEWLPEEGNIPFETNVFPPLVENGQLFAYLTDHKYYSIGTLERLAVMERFLEPKKVIFLDRDGVINRKAPRAEYVKNWDEFEILPGVVEALERLSQNDCRIYIITNQAGIARGFMTEADLASIHERLKETLREHEVRIHGIYHCPHGWDEGCECRKPKPGMFFQAARDHHLDLTRAVFIGDDERDVQAGEAAGVKTILVDEEQGLYQAVESILEDLDKRNEKDKDQHENKQETEG